MQRVLDRVVVRLVVAAMLLIYSRALPVKAASLKSGRNLQAIRRDNLQTSPSVVNFIHVHLARPVSSLPTSTLPNPTARP